MNNSPQKQDAQFAQTAAPYPYRDDEISLVDLAKTLVKRRNWLFGTFILGLLVTFLIVWLKQPQPIVENNKAFTTLLAVGYKTPRDFIEPLSGIETQLNDAFIPLASKNNAFKTSVIIENRRNITEDGNNIIKIITYANLEQTEEVVKYHKVILTPLLERHLEIINELKRQGNSQFETDDPLQLISTSIASLAQPLSTSSDKIKNKTELIIVLGMLLSAMLAIVVVFIREFASQVCKSMKEESAQ